MVIVAVGTDVVEVARLAARLERHPGLQDRLFTTRERELCAGRPRSLAARLAAKEAVLKALGSALAHGPQRSPAAPPTGWRLTDIEVSTPPGAVPGLRLQGVTAQVAQAAGVRHWHLSLSHEGALALAFVVAEGDAPR